MSDEAPAPEGSEPQEPERTAPDRARRDRVVVIASVVVIAVAMPAIAFLVGTRIAGPAAAPMPTPSPTASVSASPTPTPTPTPEPVVLGPGPRLWTDLQAGDCLAAFPSAFEPQYEVVPCDVEHAAQVTDRRVDDSGPESGYPGEETFVQSLGLDCAADSVIDLGRAREVGDLRITYSFPTAEDWAAGDRDRFCFAVRDAPFTGSVRAGG